MTMYNSILTKLRNFSVLLALAVLPATFAVAQNNPGPIPGEYIVVLKKGHKVADVAVAHGLKARRTYSHALNGFSGNIPEGRLQALKNDPRVELIEADVKMFAFAQTVPTGVRRIGNSTAAKIDGLDERVNVDIAILDTGIDLTHPDLNVYRGVSFTSDSATGNDGHGHGTHAAGSAAALDNGFGVVGVAPGARLWALKVLDNTGSGSLSAILQGVDYVTQRAGEIEVANMSLGGQGSSSSLRLAIQNSVAKGVVFVVAAGNSSIDIYGGDSTFGTADDYFPASYPEVLTVSAMADTDGKSGGVGTATTSGADDTLATFSNWSSRVVAGNPVTSPGAGIDLAAPGVNIYSTYKGGAYGTMSGTSMAAPHVAGAVALYISQYGRATTAGGVANIRQALINAAEPQSGWGINPTNPFRSDYNPEGLLRVSGIAGTPVAPTVPANNKPTVNITAPVNGFTVNAGTAVSFAGTASDVEDGNLSAKIVWSSNINGQLGIGAAVSVILSSGTHTITARVTDSGGSVATSSITVVVKSPVSASLSSVTVTDKAFYYNRGTVEIGAIVNDGSKPVSAAAVRMTLRTATGKSVVADAVTDGSGVATFRYVLNSKRDGTGVFSVSTTATRSGYNAATSSTTFTVLK